MRIPVTKGKCRRCGHSRTRAALRNHLLVCSASVPQTPARGRPKPPETEGLLIEVVGRPRAYWMFLGVACDAKLSDVDALLRATWLECCDHLSESVIGSTRYASVPSPTFSFGPRAQSMHVQVPKVFRPGVPIAHRYDFGSTTVLDLSLVGPLPIPVPPKSVALLANNEAPQFACSRCSQPAVSLCVECEADGQGFLCAACSDQHACEETLCAVVNSPRMGICGYDGPGAP
jgi:hypothetical protein